MDSSVERLVLDLYVDSKHRTEGSNYDFKIPSTDVYNSTNEYVIALKNTVISNYVYTVQANINDLLQVKITNQSTNTENIYSVVFTEGFYNAITMAEALQNLFTNVFVVNVEVDYDISILKFALTIPNNYSITFMTSESQAETYRIVRCVELLGMTNWLNTPLSAGKYVAPQMVKLSGTSYVDVCINLTTNSFNTQGSAHNVIQRIPVQVPFGEPIIYDNVSSDFGQYIQGYAMQNLRIYLIDQWGEFFKVPDEGEVVFHFKLTPISNN